MSSEGKPTISIKLLIQQERNKVILAEAGNDFVETLFSFLTFPLGTIARLVGKQQSSQPAVIGCLNNLYKSVENLSLESFRTAACKQMLLYPKNINEDKCKKLKFNIDDTEPTKYFACGNACGNASKWLSYYETSRCSCGRLMNREIRLQTNDVKDEAGGMSCKGESMFFIRDDLGVMQGWPRCLIDYLGSLGVKNLNQLSEKVMEIGSEEMCKLLCHSLISKTALTDAFLRDQGCPRGTMKIDAPLAFIPPQTSETTVKDSKTKVKLLLRKSNRKVLLVEAGEDFVDLLFTFLTIPAESVLKLLGGNHPVGCISNLFRDLNTTWSTTKEDNSLKAALPPYYNCLNKFPSILSQNPPVYYSYAGNAVYGGEYYCYLTRSYNFPEGTSNHRNKSLMRMTLMDPKSPVLTTTNSSGYVKEMSLFVVTDDLVVKPLTAISSFSLLKELDVPLDDFEEKVISIGQVEALALLRASLCSSSALSSILNVLVKQPKQETLYIVK